MSEKPKLALYWAASCGGCEIAVVNLHDRFLQLTERCELVFCPALLDTKKKDLAALPNGALAVTLFNGALRTDENVEMAQLLRRKSRVLVAFGACARSGGIPALSNLSTRQQHLQTIYGGADGAPPQQETRVPEGTLELPRFHERVKSLAAVVPVDYTIPGCPPEPERLWAALASLINGGPPPATGSVLGGGGASVCDECARERQGKTLTAFRRVFELVPDPKQCLLDQGLVCLGLGTRGGCGALCPAANMPCSGCYGAPDGVYDQPAKLVSTLGSLLDVAALRGRSEAEARERIDRTLDSLPDPAGSLGRYTLAERSSAPRVPGEPEP